MNLLARKRRCGQSHRDEPCNRPQCCGNEEAWGEWFPSMALEAVHIVASYDYAAHGVYDVRHSDFRAGSVCDRFTAKEALRVDSQCDMTEEVWTILKLWVRAPDKGVLPFVAKRMSIDIRVAAKKLRDAQEVVAEWAKNRG